MEIRVKMWYSNRFKQKNFTVSNSKGRRGMASRCAFYEYSTDASDGECLYWGH